MKWSSLLCKTRVRELLGGSASARISEETGDEFERDYGRSIFSTPVRRLQDKAQVFPLEPIDAVRTRLTHSLEVSSVARGIASGLARALGETKKLEKPEFSHDIETIAATSGLLHDLGNPPFGHAGEEAIREWFKRRIEDDETKEFADLSENEREDLLNFEGNAQTLRLLTKLQILSDRYGLNLTAGTLSALCKYTASSLELKKKDRPRSKKKLGYFTSESPVISKIQGITGTGDARHPLAILIEAADDIVIRSWISRTA
jgi:dGTPase